METPTVKDLMVPLSDYATVSEDATLHDAVLSLEKTLEEFDKSPDRHRAVLILDKNNNVIGKLSQLDVLRALEPKYDQMGDSKPLSSFGLSRFGFSSRFLRTMIDQFQLWEEPLPDICKKAGKQNVKKFMYAPSEGEYVDENANLNTAIHQLVMGHHQSLLVTHGKKKEIIGVLRLTDVFSSIRFIIKEVMEE